VPHALLNKMKRLVLIGIDEIQKVFSSINWNVISLDTETTSLSYIDLDIEGFSLTDGTTAIYVDLIDNQFKKEILSLLSSELTKVKILVGHNIVFDLKVLHKTIGLCMDHTTLKLFDTMVADHLLNENRRSHGLKYLAEHLLGHNVTAYNDIENHKSKEFYEYATNDAVWTWELMLLQRPQLEEQELTYLFTEIEMPFQWVLLEMEINGFTVDLEKVAKTKLTLEAELSKLRKKMLDTIEEPYEIQKGLDGSDEILCELNLNSSQQLAKVLFEQLKLPIIDYTPSGKPSVGVNTIKKLKDKHPFVKLLSLYKIAQKLLSAFFKPLPRLVDSDGRVRPNFRDIGTVTGRLSCTAPNLQQLPKVNKDFPIDTRECFVAPSGKKLIACDYSGQELRVLARITGEESMVDAFRKGKDFHLTTANDFFNLNIPEECLYETHKEHNYYKEKFKNERNKAKTINFGMAYGKGAYGFSKDFGISEDEAQDILDKYFAALPKVKDKIEETHKQVKADGFVTSMTGRRRRFKPRKTAYGEYYDGSSLRQSFNFLIQGYSADMIRLAMIATHKVAKANPKWQLNIVATVHDEAVYEVREDFVLEASKAIQKAFEGVADWGFPIVAETSWGDNYSEAK